MKDKSTRTIFADAEEGALRTRDFASKNNLIMRPAGRQSVVLCPPLVITRSEVDEMVEKSKLSLDQAARSFGLM